MKITTICNPKSPYYQKQVKVLNYHPNEEVEVFVIEDENLIFVPLDYLTPDCDTFKPRSRKEFYEFIQNATTSRTQMIETLKYLTTEGILKLNGATSESDLINIFSNHERSELVEKFRSLRDEGGLEFNLINNTYQEDKKKNFRNFKHKKQKQYT